MNTYYTAKDIEDMAANGTKQLVLGPGVFLTDFARETAHQLNVSLVRSEDQPKASTPPALAGSQTKASSAYNKPRGCQVNTSISAADRPQSAAATSLSNNGSSPQSSNGASPTTVNRLIDLMGKVIKRGE